MGGLNGYARLNFHFLAIQISMIGANHEEIILFQDDFKLDDMGDMDGYFQSSIRGDTVLGGFTKSMCLSLTWTPDIFLKHKGPQKRPQKMGGVFSF